MSPSEDVPRQTGFARAEDAAADTAQEAERLLRQLDAQLALLREALMARPWQAPALREIARLLEGASREAFSDKEIWGCLSRGMPSPGWAADTYRPGRMDRAIHLLDLASRRLALLPVE